jgi:hypothetical protein
MPVNEKILFRSFQYLFSPKSIIYAICRWQCCAKITLFFLGKNIDFRGVGGEINIRFRPKYRPLQNSQILSQEQARRETAECHAPPQKQYGQYGARPVIFF